MRFVGKSHVRRIVLLSPSSEESIGTFRNVDCEANRYSRLLGRMQRLRGALYLNDGAIDRSELLPDGRHRQAVDYESWHVLVVDESEEVLGCARYRPCSQDVQFRALNVSRSELAQSDSWRVKLHQAIQREIWNARERNLGFAEVGGWALHPTLRCSSEALRIALSTWALAQALGGCIGITTATLRHSSALILRKLGGSDLFIDGSQTPRYFDSRYGCDMEILRFDSSQPNPRYRSSIEELQCTLLRAQVVTSDEYGLVAAQAASARAAEFSSSLQLVPQLA